MLNSINDEVRVRLLKPEEDPKFASLTVSYECQRILRHITAKIEEKNIVQVHTVRLKGKEHNRNY